MKLEGSFTRYRKLDELNLARPLRRVVGSLEHRLFEDDRLMEAHIKSCLTLDPIIWGIYFNLDTSLQLPSLTRLLHSTYSKVKGMYGYIKDENMLWGRTYEKLNIDHVCGKVDPLFIKKFAPLKNMMVQVSKRRIKKHKQRINVEMTKDQDSNDPYVFKPDEQSPLPWIPKPTFKCLQTNKNVFHPDFEKSLRHRRPPKSLYDRNRSCLSSLKWSDDLEATLAKLKATQISSPTGTGSTTPHNTTIRSKNNSNTIPSTIQLTTRKQKLSNQYEQEVQEDAKLKKIRKTTKKSLADTIKKMRHDLEKNKTSHKQEITPDTLNNPVVKTMAIELVDENNNACYNTEDYLEDIEFNTGESKEKTKTKKKKLFSQNSDYDYSPSEIHRRCRSTEKSRNKSTKETIDEQRNELEVSKGEFRNERNINLTLQEKSHIQELLKKSKTTQDKHHSKQSNAKKDKLEDYIKTNSGVNIESEVPAQEKNPSLKKHEEMEDNASSMDYKYITAKQAGVDLETMTNTRHVNEMNAELVEQITKEAVNAEEDILPEDTTTQQHQHVEQTYIILGDIINTDHTLEVNPKEPVPKTLMLDETERDMDTVENESHKKIDENELDEEIDENDSDKEIDENELHEEIDEHDSLMLDKTERDMDTVENESHKKIDENELDEEIDENDSDKEIDENELHEEIDEHDSLMLDKTERDMDTVENESHKKIDENELDEEIDENDSDKDTDENDSDKEIDENELQEEIDKNDSDKKIDENELQEEIDENDSDKEIDKNDSDKKIDENDSDKEIDKNDSDEEIDENDSDKEIDENESHKKIDEKELQEEIDENDSDKEIDENELQEEIDKNGLDKEIDENESDIEMVNKESHEIIRNESDKEMDCSEITKSNTQNISVYDRKMCNFDPNGSVKLKTENSPDLDNQSGKLENVLCRDLVPNENKNRGEITQDLSMNDTNNKCLHQDDTTNMSEQSDNIAHNTSKYQQKSQAIESQDVTQELRHILMKLSVNNNQGNIKHDNTSVEDDKEAEDLVPSLETYKKQVRSKLREQNINDSFFTVKTPAVNDNGRIQDKEQRKTNMFASQSIDIDSISLDESTGAGDKSSSKPHMLKTPVMALPRRISTKAHSYPRHEYRSKSKLRRQNSSTSVMLKPTQENGTLPSFAENIKKIMISQSEKFKDVDKSGIIKALNEITMLSMSPPSDDETSAPLSKQQPIHKTEAITTTKSLTTHDDASMCSLELDAEIYLSQQVSSETHQTKDKPAQFNSQQFKEIQFESPEDEDKGDKPKSAKPPPFAELLSMIHDMQAETQTSSDIPEPSDGKTAKEKISNLLNQVELSHSSSASSNNEVLKYTLNDDYLEHSSSDIDTRGIIIPHQSLLDSTNSTTVSIQAPSTRLRIIRHTDESDTNSRTQGSNSQKKSQPRRQNQNPSKQSQKVVGGNWSQTVDDILGDVKK
ncbi:hypothetical protein M8J75_008838 [Diaphorina citri]|nr:hypothetical protein M8J75_008838 [Diaphorina citri]